LLREAIVRFRALFVHVNFTEPYIKVVVFRVPLQELIKSCYTVMDAVDWFHLLPQDGFRKAPTTDLYEFVN
jgi:hypothetical protein